MSDSHVQYLIIGAGSAGDAAAEAIREIDPAGSMMLVGQEINRPYHRRQLNSEYLLGTLGHDSLFMHASGWYAQQHIELRTGRIAAHLDTERQEVRLDDGSGISFDSLLIATGALPRHFIVAGAQLPNIYYPHGIEDADRLRHAALTSLRGGHARAVVTGGTLGAIEIAATLKQMGLHIDLIPGEAYLGATFMGERAAALLNRMLGKHDVNVISNARPVRFEGDGRVQRVVLDNGQAIVTDLVVALLGSIPNKQILRTTPIRAETAILVDEHCRTNVGGIFAAGECAAIYDPRYGKHRYLPHENGAAQMGRLAGRNMAGREESLSAINFVERRIFTLDFFAAGEARLVDHRLVRTWGDEEQSALLEFGVSSDGRLAHVVAAGHSPDRKVLLELIAQRVSLVGQEESIKDPEFDLSHLLVRISG